MTEDDKYVYGQCSMTANYKSVYQKALSHSFTSFFASDETSEEKSNKKYKTFIEKKVSQGITGSLLEQPLHYEI